LEKKITNEKCRTSVSKPKALHMKRYHNKWFIDIRDNTVERRATMHCDQLSSRARSSARLDFADSPAQVCLRYGAAVDSMTTSGVSPRKEESAARPLHVLGTVINTYTP